MASGELVPYKESHRDEVEANLSMRELDYAKRDGKEFFLYWRKKTNTLTGVIMDLMAKAVYIVPVENDSGNGFMQHPYYEAHKAGVIPPQTGEDVEE